MGNLLVKDVDQVRWIYFNRPEQLNALAHEDLVEAKELVEDACGSMRAIVFRGVGERSFSVGVHIDTFLHLASEPEDARIQITAVKELLDAVRLATIPTVCAINGHCLGAGMELAMVCDFRFATSNARIGLPEMKVGVPCILDSALLQQYVGLSKAKEIVLTGDLYEAEEMEKYGFLNMVRDHDELEVRTNQLLDRLKRYSSVALASQKRLFEVWQNTGLQEANEISVDEIVQVFEEEETKDKLRSYAKELRASRG